MSRPAEYHPGRGWDVPTAKDVADQVEVIAQPWRGVKSHVSELRLVAFLTGDEDRYLVRSNQTGEVIKVFSCWKRQPTPRQKKVGKPLLNKAI